MQRDKVDTAFKLLQEVYGLENHQLENFKEKWLEKQEFSICNSGGKAPTAKLRWRHDTPFVVTDPSLFETAPGSKPWGHIQHKLNQILEKLTCEEPEP